MPQTPLGPVNSAHRHNMALPQSPPPQQFVNEGLRARHYGTLLLFVLDTSIFGMNQLLQVKKTAPANRRSEDTSFSDHPITV